MLVNGQPIQDFFSIAVPKVQSRSRPMRYDPADVYSVASRIADFLFTDKPLPETSQVHMLVTVPGKPQPLSLVGKVSHTILAQDEEPPGMGIVFDLDDAQREQLHSVIKELEEALEENKLPEPIIE